MSLQGIRKDLQEIKQAADRELKQACNNRIKNMTDEELETELDKELAKLGFNTRAEFCEAINNDLAERGLTTRFNSIDDIPYNFFKI